MAKILFYACREDEIAACEKIKDIYQVEVSYTKEKLDLSTVCLAEGFEFICIVGTCKITMEVAMHLKTAGVKYILSRIVGTEHIDRDALAVSGLKAAYVPAYSPESVADFTVMLTLSCVRKLKTQIRRVDENDFRMIGLSGREMKTQTVGVIGTGRIGLCTIQRLKAFGCKVIAYDPYPKKDCDIAYMELGKLYEKSDIIILHCPGSKENYHMINEDSIAKMKDGVILINTARGDLVDVDALSCAIENGKVAAAGLDVLEGEQKFFRRKIAEDGILSPVAEKLISQDNVVYTSHVAFYTEEAVESMMNTTFQNMRDFMETAQCRNQI